ncbi:ubiquitinyl hydrolase 1 [Salvia divinorum]|uniref:Ubiquitin carboxyl-terminal hydrolase n=1 Tax=Salvia divinorum TaxID=28513 RepID=A0ABD1GV93_SALDI
MTDHEAVLLGAEKAAEDELVSDAQRLNSSPSPSASLSHWSLSWSKPSNSDEPPQKSAHVVVEFPPSSSLFNRAIIGAGLENLGNTCFLNSVLQCFIHTVPLLHPILANGYLMQSSNNCNKEQFSVLNAMRDLIFQSLVSNTTVSPFDLVNNLTHISSNFQRFQQEDAHEFLQCFLDRLEGCYEPKNNIVQQVFGGRLVSNLMCCNCGHCSDTYEPSIDLSLEIDDADNLFSALQSFTKVEKIEDPETKFTCEKCKERVYVEKKLSFDQAPEVAVLHLKRFKNYGSFVEKIDKHVAFPLDLDMQPFTGNDNHNHADLQYVLYAVVVHIGLTPTSGHYYCFIRLSAGIWCCFDDSKVELVNEAYVLSQEAYVLFYAKHSTPWFSSFIESQKELLYSTMWNTSPKSVLDNIDTSVSPYLDNKFGCDANTVSCDTGGDDNEIKDSGAVTNETTGKVNDHYLDDSVTPLSRRNEIKRKVSINDLEDSVAPLSVKPSNMSMPKDQKVSPILSEKVNHNQEVSVPQKSPIDIEAVFRSPSPEIYRKDSPPGFTICRSHLRSADRISCKRRLEEDMDDERKHARMFVMKNMPSSRSQQLMAALRGSKSEPSVNRKKTRRLSVQ